MKRASPFFVWNPVRHISLPASRDHRCSCSSNVLFVLYQHFQIFFPTAIISQLLYLDDIYNLDYSSFPSRVSTSSSSNQSKCPCEYEMHALKLDILLLYCEHSKALSFMAGKGEDVKKWELRCQP